MELVKRVQDILLKPKDTWPVIEQETTDTATLYKQYLVILAAIPAVASFIGLSLIGAGAFGVSFRVPIVTGLVMMVMHYVLTLVMVYLLSLVVNALAPTFGGTKNQLNALKLVAYASTAGFVGGIFSLLPSLALLGLLASLYSIYLIYAGLPMLMKNPAEKSLVYTVVILVCGIVAGVILAAVFALVPGGAGGFMHRGSTMGNGDVTITAPGGEVSVNASKMAALAKTMEQAQATGDTAAAGNAAAGMISAMTGAAAGVPIPAQDLKAQLPEALGDMKRDSSEAESNAAMGFAVSTAKADYAKGEKHIEVSVSDIGGGAGLMALAGWANTTMDRENGGSIEKIYKQGKRTMHEEYQKDSSDGTYTVVLENGVIVEAKGNTDIDSLKSAVNGIDLGKLESTQRAAK
jgi:hypothetical protein